MPYYTKAEYYRLLNDLVEEDGYDCVVELGSGYGRYLIEMFYNGGQRQLKYIGAELTNSGRKMMRKLFSLIPGADMEVHEFDFLRPDFSFLGKHKRVLFFTIYAIQQVQKIPMSLFEGMSSAAEYVKAVHFEPFGFQVEPDLGKGTAHHASEMKDRGWNVNLGQTLIDAHNSGLIRCTHMTAEILGGGHDPASLAVWEGGTRSTAG